MSDLTLSEKINGAEERARLLPAEKHFYDEAQPFSPMGFSVFRRNPGHWDVLAARCPGKATAWRAAHPGGFTTEQDDERERAFRIRGELGRVVVMDERWNPHKPHPRESLTFRTVSAAMLWIAEELMQEPTP